MNDGRQGGNERHVLAPQVSGSAEKLKPLGEFHGWFEEKGPEEEEHEEVRTRGPVWDRSCFFLSALKRSTNGRMQVRPFLLLRRVLPVAPLKPKGRLFGR
jgi:hypothetical protein